MRDELFQSWCTEEQRSARRKTLRLLQELPGTQQTAIELLRSIVPTRYYDPARIKAWLRKMGQGKMHLDVTAIYRLARKVDQVISVRSR